MILRPSLLRTRSCANCVHHNSPSSRPQLLSDETSDLTQSHGQLVRFLSPSLSEIGSTATATAHQGGHAAGEPPRMNSVGQTGRYGSDNRDLAAFATPQHYDSCAELLPQNISHITNLVDRRRRHFANHDLDSLDILFVSCLAA